MNYRLAEAVLKREEPAFAGLRADETGVTFTWKDYRIEGSDRYQIMTLPTSEFIRRFLTHVLPKGLHRLGRFLSPRARGLDARCPSGIRFCVQPKRVAHLAHRDPLCWHCPLPRQKPKERTLSGPAETSCDRRLPGRHHPGMAGGNIPGRRGRSKQEKFGG